MKVTGTVRAQVLAKNTTKSQDGKSTYYNLAVLIGGEAVSYTHPTLPTKRIV